MKENGKITDLSVDSLKEEACRDVNLFDWGDDDFHRPLDKLIQCFKDKYDSNTMEYFKNTMLAILRNRLFIQDNFKCHPEILAVPINRPLFIVGLARTGSTMLHRLIAQDLNFRVLQYWEMLYPFIGSHLGLNHEQVSIELAKIRIKETFAEDPNFYHIHETNAVMPEECMLLMRHTFCSMSIVSEWSLPEFAKWFINRDMTESYLYYRKLLQLLMWHKPSNFILLKCPSHLINLNAVLKIFPDANFVWLHRHPDEAIPSFLSLLSVVWGSQMEDPGFIELILKYSIRSVEGGMAVQDKINPKQWLNVGYKRLLKNPLEVIREIYQQFDYKFDERLEEKMSQWLQVNFQHKHGAHNYNLKKFGLNGTGIETSFSRYLGEYDHLL